MQGGMLEKSANNRQSQNLLDGSRLSTLFQVMLADRRIPPFMSGEYPSVFWYLFDSLFFRRAAP